MYTLSLHKNAGMPQVAIIHLLSAFRDIFPLSFNDLSCQLVLWTDIIILIIAGIKVHCHNKKGP